MNSTPVRPTSTIRFTALLPPPPTPITLIFAPRRVPRSSVSRSSCEARSSDCFMPGLLLEEFFENPAQPAGHAAERARADAGRIGLAVAMGVEHETDRRRKRRA